MTITKAQLWGYFTDAEGSLPAEFTRHSDGYLMETVADDGSGPTRYFANSNEQLAKISAIADAVLPPSEQTNIIFVEDDVKPQVYYSKESLGVLQRIDKGNKAVFRVNLDLVVAGKKIKLDSFVLPNGNYSYDLAFTI